MESGPVPGGVWWRERRGAKSGPVLPPSLHSGWPLNNHGSFLCTLSVVCQGNSALKEKKKFSPFLRCIMVSSWQDLADHWWWGAARARVPPRVFSQSAKVPPTQGCQGGMTAPNRSPSDLFLSIRLFSPVSRPCWG